jgi:hypothetical protein
MEAERYAIDPGSSRFMVRAFASGMFSAFADDISNKDRREIEQAMKQDVLEIAKYPDIVFDSLKVSASKAGDGQYWVDLVGLCRCTVFRTVSPSPRRWR